MNHLSPIVLFVYNRPWHTRQTVEALQQNDLADQSELFIYSDGPKNDAALQSVREVREYIGGIRGFRKVTLVERERNWGLAANIIDGVTTIVHRYGRVIVLEDDMITAPHFLGFMNKALECYENEKSVWHISGWNYPIEPEGVGDAFLWRTMNCWGWGTWSDRWRHFEKDVAKTVREFSRKEIRRFNLDGVHSFWSQVTANKKGEINTWAVFWYAVIFRRGGLCLNPSHTLVRNIGLDGSGTHCNREERYDNGFPEKNSFIFPDDICENGLALQRIKKFYRDTTPRLPQRLLNKFKRVSGVR